MPGKCAIGLGEPEVQCIRRKKCCAIIDKPGCATAFLDHPAPIRNRKTTEKRGPGQCALGPGGRRSNGSEDKKGARPELTGLGVLMCSLTILNLLEAKKKDKGQKEGLASAPLALGGLRPKGSEEKSDRQ